MTDKIKSIIERFQPHGTQLMCEPILSAEKTAGGIIVPEQCRNPLNQGIVIAVGDQLDPADWPLGTTVMWPMHTESSLRIDDIKLVLLNVDNVLLKSRVK